MRTVLIHYDTLPIFDDDVKSHTTFNDIFVTLNFLLVYSRVILQIDENCIINSYFDSLGF